MTLGSWPIECLSRKAIIFKWSQSQLLSSSDRKIFTLTPTHMYCRELTWNASIYTHTHRSILMLHTCFFYHSYRGQSGTLLWLSCKLNKLALKLKYCFSLTLPSAQVLLSAHLCLTLSHKTHIWMHTWMHNQMHIQEVTVWNTCTQAWKKEVR